MIPYVTRFSGEAGRMQTKKNFRMMLIDSDEHVRNAVKTFFEHSNTDILVFKSAGEGLNALKYQQIDLVISDYFLPDMNGIDFLIETGKICPTVKRIIMATIVSDHLEQDILDAGIDLCLEKPLTIASLDTIVEDIHGHV